jgi:hypothetical protein
VSAIAVRLTRPPQTCSGLSAWMKRSATIAVLYTRRMRFEHEAASVRVHERTTLTSVDFLSSIVTAWPAGLGGFGALAVDDCRRAAGVAPDPFAICHHERVVYPFKAPVVVPGGEPAVNRPPGWQVVRPACHRRCR